MTDNNSDSHAILWIALFVIIGGGGSCHPGAAIGAIVLTPILIWLWWLGLGRLHPDDPLRKRPPDDPDSKQ